MITVVLINLIITAILVGLIWTIQVVHYPLFLEVRDENFINYCKSHQNKISILVIPLMSLELIGAIYLFYLNQGLNLNNLYLLSLILVILIWLLTFLIHMPQHKVLLNGYNQGTIKVLVRTNWIRTILWTIKLVFLTKILISII